MQASAFGITQAASRVEIELRLPLADTTAIGFPDGYRFDFLVASEQARIYERAYYDFVYCFRSRENITRLERSRNKQGIREYYALLSFSWIANALTSEQLETKNSMMARTGALLIHVGAIADLVGNKFGIGNLWKPRAPFSTA